MPEWGIRMNKRGSYIVEAAVILPIFILTVVVLAGIIPWIAVCENITFSAADEMRLETVRTYLTDKGSPLALPARLKNRVERENSQLSTFTVTEYRCGYSENEIDDLITLDFRAGSRQKNPAGSFSSTAFSGSLTGRAFTGSYHKVVSDYDSNRVCIFPENGTKYHDRECTYIKSNCELVYLSQSVKASYHACPNCNSENAKIGTPVFVFESSGRAYHLGSCRSVDRYFIEVGREEAEKKGYTSCKKCGG